MIIPKGGWVASGNSSRDWIRVDFGQLVQVTGITTQGRHEGGDWPTFYKVNSSYQTQILLCCLAYFISDL